MAEWITRATIVSGTSFTGLYAADGSFNVVESNGIGFKGIYHPCGAYWVTVSPLDNHPFYAEDGSVYISQEVWNSASGGSVLLSPPERLGWTPSWSVRKTGPTYDIANLDFNSLKPTADYV